MGIEPIEALAYYACGALLWTFILGIVGDGLSWAKLAGVIIWPVPLVHFVGQLIRSVFR